MDREPASVAFVGRMHSDATAGVSLCGNMVHICESHEILRRRWGISQAARETAEHKLVLAESALSAITRLDSNGIETLLERWDLTAPAMQRRIVAAFAAKCVEMEDRAKKAEKELARLQEGEGRIVP